MVAKGDTLTLKDGDWTYVYNTLSKGRVFAPQPPDDYRMYFDRSLSPAIAPTFSRT